MTSVLTQLSLAPCPLLSLRMFSLHLSSSVNLPSQSFHSFPFFRRGGRGEVCCGQVQEGFLPSVVHTFFQTDSQFLFFESHCLKMKTLNSPLIISLFRPPTNVFYSILMTIINTRRVMHFCLLSIEFLPAS